MKLVVVHFFYVAVTSFLLDPDDCESIRDIYRTALLLNLEGWRRSIARN